MDNESDVSFEGPRGMLTEHDRKYLSNQIEYENKNSEAKKRQKIRQQVINGVSDFVYLAALSDEDLELVFEVFDEAGERGLDFSTGVFIAMHFFYQGLGREIFEETVTDQIRRDVQQMYADNGKYAPVDVEVKVDIDEPVPVDEKIQRVIDGEEVTQDFLNVLSYLGRGRDDPAVRRMHEEHPDL